MSTAIAPSEAPLRGGSRLARWLDRLQPSPSVVVGAAAVVTGLLAAAGVWAFREVIRWTHAATFDWLANRHLAALGAWRVAVLPALGCLVAGLLLRAFVGHERHHGVAGVIEAVALMGGRLRYWRMPAKAIGAGIAIGAGASVGPEDPSVQIGAHSGSMLGQLLRLSDERVKALVAAGSAAGLAAAFNAPIAGVFFALEVVLGEIGGAAFSAVVLAAVTSAAATQALSGSEPAFHIPQYTFSLAQLPLFLALGVVAGPVAAAYVALLGRMPEWLRRLPVPPLARLTLAGLVVGIVGVFRPRLFGVGYDAIAELLGGHSLVLGVLLALVVGKLILTPLCIGAGVPGGVFAPALFTGAALGGVFGVLVHQLSPGLVTVPAGFAMVGMAAVLAGAVHAPLTAILLVFEMTNDYHIILPVMGASIVAVMVERRLAGESVYTLALARRGVRIERGRDVEVLAEIRVGEVMETRPLTAREDETVEQAMERMTAERRHGLPVVDARGELVGVLALQDVQVAQAEPGGGERRVGEVCSREPLVAHPDESLGEALRRMSVRDVGRLPVVDPARPRELLGVLRRADVVRAYDLALSRRARGRHRLQHLQLGERSGVDVEELTVEAGSPCAGQPMRLVGWPPGALVASVRRRGRVFVPHGDTALEVADVLIVVAEPAAREQMRRLCAPPG